MRFLLYLLGLVIFAAIILVAYLIGLGIEMLPETAQNVLLTIGFVIGIIAANISEYRYVYIKGKGKPWYFWLTFGTTIAFALLVLSLFLK